MAAWKRLRTSWRRLRHSPPGRRFQDRYARAHAAREHAGHSRWRRILVVIAAIAALAVGLVEILFPGPAVFFIFIGAALLAGESKGVARLLDRTELRLRSAASWARRAWNRASIFVRALVLGAAALASGAAAFLTYQWLAD